MRDKGTHQHGGFTLTDEGRSSSDDGLGARDSEGPEDKGGELADEPLQEANVVQDLDEGDEEDDGGDDAEEEHAQTSRLRVSQEGHSILRKAQQITSAVGNEPKNVVTDAGAQDEETNDVLREHTNNDGAPVDALAVLASEIQDEQEDGKTKQAHGAVLAGVVSAFLGDEGANEHDGDGQSSTTKGAELLRNEVVDDKSRVLPDPADGARDVARGDVEEEQAQRDAEPDKERHNPVLVLAVQDERCNPPAGEEQEDEQVDERAQVAVEDAQLAMAATGRVILRHSRLSRSNSSLALLVVAVFGGRMHRRVVNAMLVLVLVQRALRRDDGRVQGSSGRVGGVVGASEAGRVVQVMVLVLIRSVERRI